MSSTPKDTSLVAKHTIKDSVFTKLFEDKKYLLQLYKVLHEEDTDTTENDIKNITLKNILVGNKLYNDLGFMVGDRLIILVEAQSTWTPNIIIRSLLYLADTYHNFYIDTDQNLHGTKKVSFPKPELYMIYIGDKSPKKQVLSLSEEFLNNESSSVEIRVNVIYDSKKGDIINQYINFTKVYNEQVKIHGRTATAVLETIKICEDKNILSEFLKTRESEVRDTMMLLFDQEYITNREIERAKIEAEARGEAIGKAKGEAIGKAKGEAIGIITTCKDLGVSFSETIKRISDKFNISLSEAEIQVKECW